MTPENLYINLCETTTLNLPLSKKKETSKLPLEEENCSMGYAFILIS